MRRSAVMSLVGRYSSSFRPSWMESRTCRYPRSMCVVVSWNGVFSARLIASWLLAYSRSGEAEVEEGLRPG